MQQEILERLERLEHFMETVKQERAMERAKERDAYLDKLMENEDPPSENYFIWLPTLQNAIANRVEHTSPIPEEGYITRNEYVDLLMKYKHNPDAIQYLAEMAGE